MLWIGMEIISISQIDSNAIYCQVLLLLIIAAGYFINSCLFQI